MAQGRFSAGRVVEQILSQVPEDELVPAANTVVAVNSGLSQLITPTAGAPMSDHAFAQLTGRQAAQCGASPTLCLGSPTATT